MQVMNCNSGSKDAVGLVAYLPNVEVSEGEKETTRYKNARFHVLQECIGQIIQCIETRSNCIWNCIWCFQRQTQFLKHETRSFHVSKTVFVFGNLYTDLETCVLKEVSDF